VSEASHGHVRQLAEDTILRRVQQFQQDLLEPGTDGRLSIDASVLDLAGLDVPAFLDRMQAEYGLAARFDARQGAVVITRPAPARKAR